MKFVLLLTIIIFIACTSSKLIQLDARYSNKKGNNSLTSCRVYKIDSINTYYLIYAKKGDSLYKIVSKKEIVENCDRIQISVRYDFKLHSSLTDFHIGNVLVSSKQLPHVNCFYYDDSTKICLERDSINDLHFADNIKGLCFIHE